MKPDHADLFNSEYIKCKLDFFSEPRHLNLLQEINYSKLKNTLDKLIFLLVTFIIFISDINVSFVIIIIVLFQNQKIE